MRKTLIFYAFEYYQAAKELRDNYITDPNWQVDLICTTEQNDIEYAQDNNYTEAIFIEDLNAVIISDIETGYIYSGPISECYILD